MLKFLCRDWCPRAFIVTFKVRYLFFRVLYIIIIMHMHIILTKFSLYVVGNWYILVIAKVQVFPGKIWTTIGKLFKKTHNLPNIKIVFKQVIGNILESRKTSVIVVNKDFNVTEIKLQPINPLSSSSSSQCLSPTILPNPNGPEIEELIVQYVMTMFNQF